MFYLDLDEVARLVALRWLSHRPWSLRTFLPSDHLALEAHASDVESLAERVRQFVSKRTGMSLDGPVRLLTQLRQFGYYFSPLNLFYCFDRGGGVQAVVAEVGNTPWREQHLYVLWEGNRSDVAGEARHAYAHGKEFHVSPFMPMQVEYQWRIGLPGESLDVSIANRTLLGEKLFDASMRLSRRSLSGAHLWRHALRFPWATVQIITAIYWQAAKLWCKQCPYYPHPQQAATSIVQK
jgi:DUF1365 family protein